MRPSATLLLLAAAPAAAIFPGAGTLCEAVFDHEVCELVAQFDPLHEDFVLDFGGLFDPLGLFDGDSPPPPPPSPSPPSPSPPVELGDVGSGSAGSGA